MVLDKVHISGPCSLDVVNGSLWDLYMGECLCVYTHP